MPRFVILEHDQPVLHWDFMLEAGDVLRTWRLSAPPCAGGTVHAEPSFAHRKMYLDYEGPLSGGRGVVRRWDQGTYTPELPGTSEDERVVVTLAGGRVRGTATLVRSAAGEWSLSLAAEG